MNAIDTNVLVYAVDESEPTKQANAIDLLEKLSAQPVRLVVLWQVAVEFVACLRRWESAGRLTREDTLEYKSELLDPLPIIMPSPAILQVSLDLSGRCSLSHWDSCIFQDMSSHGRTALPGIILRTPGPPCFTGSLRHPPSNVSVHTQPPQERPTPKPI